MGAEAEGLDPFSIAFPKYKKGTGWEVNQPEHEPVHIQNADTQARLSTLCQGTGLSTFFFQLACEEALVFIIFQARKLRFGSSKAGLPGMKA